MEIKMKISLNKTLTALFAFTTLSSFDVLADVEIGLSLGTSKPKNYVQCACTTDGAITDIEAEVDIDLAVAQLRYVFDNGIFVEFRHGMGFSKSESKVTPRGGESTRGLDIELDGLTNASIGYRFFSVQTLSTYVMLGTTINIVLTAFMPDGPEFRRENYSNEFSYGAGVNWNVSQDFIVGLEYFQYSNGDLGGTGEVDLSTWSASLAYRF
jgi:opacity protein-like surface antigen